jgi:hypothetical protein
VHSPRSENGETMGRGGADESGVPAPAKGATRAVASIATALALIVFTVPPTTLTATAHALGAGPGAQAWILNAMSVGAASGLLGSGAVGDWRFRGQCTD